MHFYRSLTIAGMLATSAMAGTAHAAPGDSSNTDGAAYAVVVEANRLIKVDDLRFGTFAQPSAAASVTVTPAGAVSATGELVSGITMSQPPPGRGPAQFRADGSANRAFVVLLPNSITMSNGTATMNVTNITSNLPNSGRPRLDASGIFYLFVGGTLQVGALQQPGAYSGDFAVSVIYQ